MTFRNVIIIFFCALTSCAKENMVATKFPLNNYNQEVSYWISQNNPTYSKPLVSYHFQLQHKNELYQHLYGINSPWNSKYVINILSHAREDNIVTIELENISHFDNRNNAPEEIGYDTNYHPHTAAWINAIRANIKLHYPAYSPKYFAIATDNLLLRALPTDDPSYYHYKIPGQGYPFDNLQLSAVWAGTPLYVITTSRDRMWALVISPDFIGWVKNNNIAYVSKNFIADWKYAAKQYLFAVTKTNARITDQHNQYRFTAYIGSVFPGDNENHHLRMMIPIRDATQTAHLTYVPIENNIAQSIPLTATPEHFANLMDELIERPYGWGNLNFHNDCSAELKNLFTPFGIWLPRHSSNQLYVGKEIDLTSLSSQQRLSYLMQNGHPLMTIVYVGGHVFLYVGTFTDQNNKPFAMTYQNLWGLSPHPATRRAVIGQSVLFPLQLSYPEDKELISQAGRKHFQLSYLDQKPDINLSEKMDLRAMMCP